MTGILDAAGIPDACTLPTAERPMRLAEFDDVFARVVGIDRPSPRHARLRLAGPDDLAEQVRDLAARETECCSFFTFTVTPAAPGAGGEPGEVMFEIEVPEEYTAVLDGMVERAGAGAGG